LICTDQNQVEERNVSSANPPVVLDIVEGGITEEKIKIPVQAEKTGLVRKRNRIGQGLGLVGQEKTALGGAARVKDLTRLAFATCPQIKNQEKSPGRKEGTEILILQEREDRQTVFAIWRKDFPNRAKKNPSASVQGKSGRQMNQHKRGGRSAFLQKELIGCHRGGDQASCQIQSNSRNKRWVERREKSTGGGDCKTQCKPEHKES